MDFCGHEIICSNTACCMHTLAPRTSSRYTNPTIVTDTDNFPIITLLHHGAVPDHLARGLPQVDSTVDLDCISRPLPNRDQLQVPGRRRGTCISALCLYEVRKTYMSPVPSGSQSILGITKSSPSAPVQIHPSRSVSSTSVP